MAGASNGELRQRKPTAVVTPTEEGKKRDERLDKHERCANPTNTRRCSKLISKRYEFGGPLGVTAMMTGFPILMYYLWICLWFYDGQLVYPKSLDDVQPFLHKMWEHVRVVSNASFASISQV